MVSVSIDNVVIEEENFYDIFPDTKELREANHAESPIAIPGLTLNLNVEKYKKASAAGNMMILGVRDAGKLIGYHFTFIDVNLHFSVLAGYSDGYYLDPAYRGTGLGKSLMRYTEQKWAQRGCKLGFIGTRNEKSYVDFFVAMDWTPNEQTLVKKLGEF